MSPNSNTDSNEQDQNDADVVETAESTTEIDNEQAEAGQETLEQAEAHIEDELSLAEKKAEENWQLLLRTKAEMENLRKRTHKDLENAHKFAIEKFVAELVPVKESMELGLQTEDASIDALREGMELTINMLSSVFEKFNIAEIDPINEKFDPELHQAMSMQPSDDVEPNTVIAVMQKGYSLNERLIRPAMVMVSKAADA